MEIEFFVKEVQELRIELFEFSHGYFLRKRHLHITDEECFNITSTACLDMLAWLSASNKINADCYKEVIIKTFDRLYTFYEKNP